MSNQKLASSAGRYGVAKYPDNLQYFQRLYDTRRYRTHPVTIERLAEFAEDLKIICKDVKFIPDFVTEDEVRWTAVKFRYVTGNKFILAFAEGQDPKHRDRTISSHHVAIFSLDEDVSEEELNYVTQATFAIYHTYSN